MSLKANPFWIMIGPLKTKQGHAHRYATPTVIKGYIEEEELNVFTTMPNRHPVMYGQYQ